MSRIHAHIPALFVAILCAGFACQPVAAQSYLRTTGNQFTLNGSTYKIKGSNYYPASAPWGAWFGNWNWAEITRDVDRLHGLGINSMRINLPYSAGGWGGANVNQGYLDKLERLVEYLRYRGMKANITLFDWETSFPAAGTSTEIQHKQYVTAIVSRLKDNPGVFVWDVKNEPDHPDNIGGYDNWDSSPASRDKIVSWLSRMCATVRSVDTNGSHLVSSGIRWYSNVKDVISFEDVAIFHSYWGNIGTVQIPTVAGYTTKPILVQEFGWPSQPHPCWRGYWQYDFTEPDQLNFFTTHLQAFAAHDIGGCIQWQACDLKGYVSDPNTDTGVSFENYFGLWRLDGSLKPAALYYRDHWTAAFFPYSDSTTPVAPTGTTATGQDRSVLINFTHSASADCAGTMVRYSATGYPVLPTDGTLVERVPGEGKSTGVTGQGGLQAGTKYYFSLWAYDYAGNYSSRVTISATTLPQPANLLSGASVDAFTGGVANGWTPYERYASGCTGPISFASDSAISASGGVSQKIYGLGADVLPSAAGQYAHAGIMQSVAATPGKTYLLVGWEQMTAGSSGSYYFRTFGIDPTGSTSPGAPGCANVAGARWMGPDGLFWNSDAGGSNTAGMMYRCVSAVTAASNSISCWAGVGTSLVNGRSPSDKINYDNFFLHEIDNPINASLVNSNMEGAALDCNDANVHVPSGWSPVGGGYGRYVGWDMNTSSTYAHGGSKSAMFLCYPGRCEQGLMQRVAAYRGEALTASVYARGVPVNAATTAVSVGIDPTGGTDLFGPSVVWSTSTIGASSLWTQLTVSTTAQATSATVFIRASSGFVANGYHTVFVDDASFSSHMTATSPVQLKSLPDSRPATLNGCIVTATFGGYFYVQDSQRLSGIKVVSTAAVSPGQKVDVSGTVSTVGGERQLVAGSVVIKSGSYPVPVPLGIRIGSVGGAGVGPYTCGVPGSSGPNNTGLLISVWGRVTASSASQFTISCGPGSAIKVYGSASPALGCYVSVVGISSCEIPAGGVDPVAVVRARSAADVTLRN